jgi:hypothetical protein
MAFFTPQTAIGSQALPAVTSYFGAWGQRPIILPIDPWFQDHVLPLPGAKLITNIPISLHAGTVTNWDGRWVFGGAASIILTATRGARTIGAHMTKIGPASEIDFTGWNQRPDTLATAIGNDLPTKLACLLNGCYSGYPQDAAGNRVQIAGLSTCIDQIYGGAPAAPSSNVNTVAITSGGTLKPANPADPSILSDGATGWFNTWQNFDADNPNNWLQVINNINRRPAHNGVPMVLASKQTMKLFVSPQKFENRRVMFTVMTSLANSGVASKIEYTATGASTPTVVFGNQTNHMFGRLIVEPVPGLRSDLDVLAAPLPPQYPQLRPFLYPHGGKLGTYEINEDAGSPNNDTVPHMFVKMFDTNSGLYEGLHAGIPAGSVGIAMILNEGAAWASGFAFEFLFSGSAS